MNAGATAERVYDALKRRILAREFRPGDRLDPAALCETLSSSVTPVRDALHVLTGERLVEARASDGFHLPQIDAPALQDLYAWNAEVLGLALRRWRPRPPTGESPLPTATNPSALAAATATTFAAVALRSTNLEHRLAVASGNDRLHAVRLAETRVIDGIEDELAALGRNLTEGRTQELRRAITAYHRRRLRAAAEVVRTLYRNGER